jgi:pimeloyl-ACP methyl ester carboxylesterase
VGVGCATTRGAVSPGQSASLPARLEGTADQYFQIDDFRIRYREIGHGQPVVLLHGRTNALEVWALIADSLATDHRVIALDERGHGRSTKSGDPARYGRAMAEDVLGVLNHLGLRQAALVGHSQGALLAAYVAMHMPERVTKVALLAGPFFPDSATYARENAILIRDLESGHGFESVYRARGATDSAARAASAATMAHNDAASLAAVMKAQGALMPDRALVARATVPALFVAGERDELREYNRTLAALWPGARFVEISGATHMAILRDLATVAALRAYLAQ